MGLTTIMSTWYNKVTSDLSMIPDCISYYEQELIYAKAELAMKGKQLEKLSAEMPQIVDVRFCQLQEIEAILEYLNILYRKERTKSFRGFLENYNRALSSRDAEKYVDGDQSVIDSAMLVNRFSLVRNTYHGILKSLEAKQFQLNNIVKLRVAGMDDATL